MSLIMTFLAQSAYLLGLFILIFLSVMAFWKEQPVLFLLAAGVSMMVGLYTPDALSSMEYRTFGIGIGTMIILYSFLCLGFAYATLFKRREE